MPLLILKLFNASYYCVEQYSYIEVRATKREKKKVCPVVDRSIVSVQVKVTNQSFPFLCHIIQTASFSQWKVLWLF